MYHAGLYFIAAKIILLANLGATTFAIIESMTEVSDAALLFGTGSSIFTALAIVFKAQRMRMNEYDALHEQLKAERDAANARADFYLDRIITQNVADVPKPE